MQKEDIKIVCQDGVALAATLYTPSSIKGAVMIAPATGIKRRFYNAFASFLAEVGYGVICFDNRGIGDSQNGSINGVNATLINWGRFDQAAVLATLERSFPNQAYHLIGHSAGGQLVGLMDNYAKLTSMFNVASSSGSLRNMEYPFKLEAVFYLNLFIPVSNLLFGKTNSQWVGMGEPLPKAVAKQWSKWCNGSGYVATDFGKDINEHRYNDVAIPSMWLHAIDDGIANLVNVKDMVRVYPKSNATIVSLEPNKNGLKGIGHMGFFRTNNNSLWEHAISWLDKAHKG